MLGFLSRAGYLSTAVLLLASSVSAAGALGIKNGKVAVTSPDGLTDATYTYVPLYPYSSHISTIDMLEC